MFILSKFLRVRFFGFRQKYFANFIFNWDLVLKISTYASLNSRVTELKNYVDKKILLLLRFYPVHRRKWGSSWVLFILVNLICFCSRENKLFKGTVDITKMYFGNTLCIWSSEQYYSTIKLRFIRGKLRNRHNISLGRIVLILVIGLAN